MTAEETAKKIRIALIDDHTLFRSGLKALLTRQSDFEIVGEAADGLEGVKLVEQIKPDIVLLDLDMPTMSGNEALAQILETDPSMKVLMLTVSEDGDDLAECMRLGAVGYLLKKIDVTTPSDTRIVSITVADHDPVQAMNIANSVRENASTHIQNVMDIDAVNVAETANMPTEKASPGCSKWALIGGLLGCLGISAIILIRYLMDDTIKSSDDIEKYLGLSTLALIPMKEAWTTSDE